MALLRCDGCFDGYHEVLIGKACFIKIALCPHAWLSAETVFVREDGKRRNAEIPAGLRPDFTGVRFAWVYLRGAQVQLDSGLQSQPAAAQLAPLRLQAAGSLG